MKFSEVKRAVVAIYIDPDFYPPTINAILNLADQMDEVIVISRNNSTGDYPYPPNVKLKKLGKQIAVRDLEKLPVWKKLLYFLQFTLSLYRFGRKKNTDLLLLYDPLALFAFFLVKNIRRGKKVWYHNHDMPDKSRLSRFSTGVLAARYEAQAMSYIDFFSLPSKDRLVFYPDTDPSIPVFIIPNYPSLKVYRRLLQIPEQNKKIRLIYQGFIGKGHGLETFIEILTERINGYELNLVLKGSVTESYKEHLKKVAKSHKVSDKVSWIEIGPYSELPLLTGSCDIGIGINTNTDPVSQTQATASNKIYEYAASGLPVILNNSEQFTKYLGKYTWVFFTDGTTTSICSTISVISEQLKELKLTARQDFEELVNFENNFCPALKVVINSKNG